MTASDEECRPGQKYLNGRPARRRRAAFIPRRSRATRDYRPLLAFPEIACD